MLSVESNRSRWYQSALSEGKQFQTNHFRPDLRRQIDMFVFNSESDDPAVEEWVVKMLTLSTSFCVRQSVFLNVWAIETLVSTTVKGLFDTTAARTGA